MNERTNDMYGKMTESLANALKYRAELQEQQREIDAKIEDVTRVILAMERFTGALEPAVGFPVQQEDALEQASVVAMQSSLSAMEREAAIASAA